MTVKKMVESKVRLSTSPAGKVGSTQPNLATIHRKVNGKKIKTRWRSDESKAALESF